MLQECYECFKSAWSVFKKFFDDAKDILEKDYYDGDDIFEKVLDDVKDILKKLSEDGNDIFEKVFDDNRDILEEVICELIPSRVSQKY